jgi:GTPase SAR1 family protein
MLPFFATIIVLFNHNNAITITSSVSNDLDVPQITVVGQQSSGKSSLIEAMSGVPFPRDKGTCTRFVHVVTLVFSIM